jgi:hypothetical protein
VAMKPNLIPIIEAGTFQSTVIHSKPRYAGSKSTTLNMSSESKGASFRGVISSIVQ